MKRVLFWVVVVLVAFTFVAPLAWMYLTSFKSNADIYTLDVLKIF